LILRFPKRHLGRFVKRQRTNRGLSQETVAYDLGYKSRQFISNVERGFRLIPTSKVDTLAKLLAVDPKELKREIQRDRHSAIKSELAGDP
jgi:transcriptional regulator with XRE-family HTH domain